jgi:hypothetical protein
MMKKINFSQVRRSLAVEPDENYTDFKRILTGCLALIAGRGRRRARLAVALLLAVG